MKYEYYIECFYLDKWLRFKSGLSLQYAKGYFDRHKQDSPRFHTRLVRSDGKIIDEVLERNDVSIGQVAGWPTAEQYEMAAEKALKKAAEIRLKRGN